MEVSEKQIFNLWDTNGRRSDILNALSIYLNIIKEMKDEGDFDRWAAFPNSLTQLSFYQKAIVQSPEVFKKHPQFDTFADELGLDFSEALNKQKISRLLSGNQSMLDTLDKAIEQRARHYTSNLVRFGLATDNRSITPAGQAFINNKIDRDSIETFLPLNDVNILLLRQLMKLRILSKNVDGKRVFYSPFFVSLYLLIRNDYLDKDDFTSIVQGLNPYFDIASVQSHLLCNKIKTLLDDVTTIETQTPLDFLLPTKVNRDSFNGAIKNRKSGEAISCYYVFYSALYDFLNDKNNENYEVLKSVYLDEKDKIKKAFCLGRTLFDFGSHGIYDLHTFLVKNKDNPYFSANNFNSFFYEYYEKSKYVDAINEYSDTTMRALGASGLFKFKPNVCLSNRKLVQIIFSKFDFSKSFFGEITEKQYIDYEKKEENATFGSNITIAEILHYSENDVNCIIDELFKEYGTKDAETVKSKIETKVSDDFKQYVEENYPKEKLVDLLQLISDRKNDNKVKELVNPSATVPTIYEYLIGIAWYYISNKDFDLHASLNMTLNADFEPEMHAGGGIGDIVINYPDKSIMLEVTLMNKSAQKRGEWEPVLRHSLNNKANHMDIDTLTFFVADELDYNTINIWRAVAAAPLRSTNGEVTDINGVIIMPFTNLNIIDFVVRSISSQNIIQAVKKSFDKVPKITEANWFNEIIESL